MTVERGLDTPHPINLYVENGSGSVKLHATQTATTQIRIEGQAAEQVEIRQDGEAVSVIAPKNRGFFSNSSLDIEISMPATSRVVAKTASADVRADGPLGGAKIKSGSGEVVVDAVTGIGVFDTGSGDIRIDDARAEMRIRSGSGNVVVAALSAAGTAAVSTGSGDVRLGRVAGPVAVKTGSGDLEVGEADGDVTMKTGSGSTIIRQALRGRITSKSASGSVEIGIPEGTPVWTEITSVTGSLHSRIQGVGEPEKGADHVEVRATTVSGDVVLLPA